jgi:hypothetical protein
MKDTITYKEISVGLGFAQFSTMETKTVPRSRFIFVMQSPQDQLILEDMRLLCAHQMVATSGHFT